MVTVDNFRVTVGVLTGIGDTIISCCALSASTYSSKERVIVFSVKLREESCGSALRKTGGKLSLGPPSGGIIVAQPGRTTICWIKKRIMRSNRSSFFISIMAEPKFLQT